MCFTPFNRSSCKMQVYFVKIFLQYFEKKKKLMEAQLQTHIFFLQLNQAKCFITFGPLQIETISLPISPPLSCLKNKIAWYSFRWKYNWRIMPSHRGGFHHQIAGLILVHSNNEPSFASEKSIPVNK